MAKADMTRDYYADLELPFGAADIEIKKQFKRLAMRYHPDRNPGRETEVNPKFQTIQAAHELLTDPEQRSKYDAVRLKAASGGRYSTYGNSSAGTAPGTRGNPWSNAGSQWAPPPKPPPREFERRRPPPSSGAQRWAEFVPPNGAAPKQNADAESRRRTYMAWENLKQPSRSWSSPSDREEGSFRTPRSKPDYEGYRDDNTHYSSRTSPSRSSSSRYTSKKNTFEDGPSAANTSAYSNYRNAKPSSTKRYPPDPPPRPADPYKESRDTAGVPFEQRHRTPYATHGGEKTDPFEAVNISRSKSTRMKTSKADSYNTEHSSRRESNDRTRSESPRPRQYRHASSDNRAPRVDSDLKNGAPKNSPSQKNKSAKSGEHVPPRPKYPTGANITSPSCSDEEKKSSPDIKQRTYAKARAPKSTNQEQQPPPETPKGGQNASQSDRTGINSQSDSDPTFRGGAENGPKMYSIPNEPVAPNFFPLNEATRFPANVAQPTKHKDQSLTALNLSTSASSGALKTLPEDFEPSVTRSSCYTPSGARFLTPPNVLNSFEAVQFRLLDELVSQSNSLGKSSKLPNNVAERSSKPHAPGQAMRGFNHASKIPRSIQFHKACASCVAQCPTGAGSPCKQQRLKGSSCCATHQIRSYLGLGANNQTNIANKHSTNSFSFNMNDPYITSNRGPSHSVENISTTFSSEYWTGKFQAGDVFGPQPSNGANPRPGSRARTRTMSPTKGPSTGRQGISDPANEPHGLRESKSADTPIMPSTGVKFNAEEWEKTFKPQTFAPPEFPSATTPTRPGRPIKRPSKTGPTAGKGVSGGKSASSTTINESDTSEPEPCIGKNSNTKDGPPAPTPSPNAMDIDIDQPPPPNVSRPKQNDPVKPRRRSTKSTDSEGLKTNFDDLKNAEPLHNPATGLNSFDDLASNIPFPSKASSTLQFSRSFNSGKLNLPSPPREPVAPPIPPVARRPSESSWEAYVVQFKTYMDHWNAFNSKMINHFIGRQAQVMEMPSGWLAAFGDTAIGNYREGLKQDDEVRAWWDIACSKHRLALENFQWYRECMREGVQKAGPPPRKVV